MSREANHLSDAREWFVFGDIDLRGAEVLMRHNGPPESVALLLQQACEKYLKGYLVYQGWSLIKTHDLERLLHETLSFDESFSGFLEIGRKLSGLYMKNRYPPTPVSKISSEMVENLWEEALQLINKIKAVLPHLSGNV